jgi:rsbT antagonist protein RsbS
MDETSAPIIRLYGNLIVPVRAVSDQGVPRLLDEVTGRIANDAARGLILDVSGLAYMDSFVTRVVRDLALIARLMGVTTVLSGVAPDVAITIIEMGLELQGVVTTLNLERALEHLARTQREEEAEAAGHARGLAG